MGQFVHGEVINAVAHGVCVYVCVCVTWPLAFLS